VSNSKPPQNSPHGNKPSPSPKQKLKPKSKKRQRRPPPDARKQLYNEGKIGLIQDVQVSTERIMKLNGILFDLDADKLKQGPLIPNRSLDPSQFYSDCVQPWQTRHPVLEQLEVRISGTGLHGILWLDESVEFADDAQRDRWCSIYTIVQSTLPTDPNAPGITATTRALGSINSRNNQTVRILRKGGKVSAADVIGLQEQMCATPFKTLFHILTGADRMSPCPFCSGEGTTMSALDHVGMCYGCGKVTFVKLCQELFQQQTADKG
jgi:hypothetical protein